MGKGTHPLAALPAEERAAALETVDRRLARMILPGTLLHPLAAALLLPATIPAIDKPDAPLGAFVLLVFLLAGARATLGAGFERLHPRWPRPWRFGVFALTATLLLCWGLLAAFLLAVDPSAPGVTLALLLCAAAAAGVHSVFAAHFSFAVAAHALLLGPPLVALALGRSPAWLPLAVTLGACGTYFVVLSSRRSREFWEHRIGNVRLEESVSELERLNQELQQKSEEAVNAAATRTRFIANTSHELRTPLHSILGNAELLLAAELEERPRNLARAILGAGRSLLRLVNDVLELARVEAGEVRIEVDVEEPRKIVNSVTETVRGLARPRGLEVALIYAEATPRLLLMDGERYKQILTNLAANAVKFTPAGQVSIAVNFDDASDPPRLETAVTDTGPGIPVEKQQAIFEDFVQLDSGMDRRYEGSGLGLAICKRLVEAMDGDLGVEGAPTGGSTFWFSIPVRPASTVEHRLRSSGRVMAVKERDGYVARLLIVDDNASNRELAVEQIRHLGHDADAVDGAQAAFEALERYEYDLVLLDCQMPEIDGYEAARRIRAMQDNINQLVPIVAVTANAMPEERSRCLQAGMDDYMSKPLDLQMLDRVLNVWIRGEAQPRAGAADRHRSEAPELSPPVAAARLEELRGLQQALGKGAVEEILEAFEVELERSLESYQRALAAGRPSDAARALDGLMPVFSDLGLTALKRQLAQAIAVLANLPADSPAGNPDSRATASATTGGAPRARELAASAAATLSWLRAALDAPSETSR